jgi:hypothetical protein
MNDKQESYFKNLGLILIGYFSLLIIINFSQFNQIPGYGGDQLSIYDNFIENEAFATPFQGIGIADYYIKSLFRYYLSAKTSVLLLFVFPFVMNFAAAVGSVRILSEILGLNSNQRNLILILIWLQPLSISLMLSGHHTFVPALVLYASLVSRNSSIYSILSVTILFFINPYLSFGFLIISAGLDILIRNSRRSMFFLTCLLFIFLKGLIDLYYIFDYSKFLQIDISDRVRGEGSGIYPLNWLMPDINSFVGFYFRDFKNAHYQYLNVPESNYTILMPIVFFCCIGARVSKYQLFKLLLLWCLLHMLLTFPPHTDRFGGIYFPSYGLNMLLPELRIISRFSVFIDYLFFIYLTSKYLKVHLMKGILTPIILAALLPLNIPFYDVAKMKVISCDASIPRVVPKSDYWSLYYSKHFSGIPVQVFSSLNSDGILNFCALENGIR